MYTYIYISCFENTVTIITFVTLPREEEMKENAKLPLHVTLNARNLDKPIDGDDGMTESIHMQEPNLNFR